MISSGIVFEAINLGDCAEAGVSDDRYHHTITNHNAIPVRGIHGRGMHFNGTTAYLDCGNHSSLDIIDAITIETWVKVLSITGGGQNRVVNKGTDKYVLYFSGSATPSAYLTGVSTAALQFGDAVTLSEWTYLAFTYDKSVGASNYNTYFNGRTSSITTVTGAITTDLDILTIGAYYDGSLNFDGTISSVTICNCALHPDTIKLHYLQQSPYYQQEAPTIIL